MKVNSFIQKIAIFFFLLFITENLFPQNVSKKQDVAIFPLSFYGWIIPESLYTGIDSEIMRNFFTLERFNVIAMGYRFSHTDLESFNDAVLRARETESALPEEVLMGHEAFTKADWEKTVNAYYIVVPIVQTYSFEKIQTEEKNENKEKDKNGVSGSGKKEEQTDFTYKVKCAVEFHIYSMQKKMKISYFVINGSSESGTLQGAVDIAVTVFGIKLERALRGVEDFIIKTGVIKTEKGNVYFELGNELGVKKGDEYAVIGYDENNTELETGLVVVTGTEENASTALTLYANQHITVGDQLKEVPRFPFDIRVFFTGEFTLKIKDAAIFQFGIHVSQTRGFYRLRPCYAVEVGFSADKSINGDIPFSVLIGMEIWNTYFGRIQILPTIQFFYAAFSSDSKGKKPQWESAETGLKTFVHTSWLVSRDIKIGFDAGCKAGFDFYRGNKIVFRPLLGAGITIKF